MKNVLIYKYNRHFKTIKSKRALTGFLFTLPGLIGFIVFVVIPLLLALKSSFTVGGSFVFFQNYTEIFHSKSFILALKNTALFIVIFIPELFIISMTLAIIFTSYSKKLLHPSLLQTSLLVPLAIPNVTAVLLVFILFSSSGFINIKFGSNINWLNSTPYSVLILMVLYVWQNFGYVMIIFIAALASVDKEIYEAAECDGANLINRFTKISLPLIMPYVFFAFIISVANIFKIYRFSYSLMGNYTNSSVYLLQNYIINNLSNGYYSKVSAAAMVFLFLMGGLIVVMIRMSEREKKWR